MRILKRVLLLALTLVVPLSLVAIANAADFSDDADISYMLHHGITQPKRFAVFEQPLQGIDGIGRGELTCMDGRSGKPTTLTYQQYQKGFGMIWDELKLNPEHRPHDGRKHFVTMAKKVGVDEYAIKYSAFGAERSGSSFTLPRTISEGFYIPAGTWTCPLSGFQDQNRR